MKYSKYHCSSFEDATILTPICFDAVIKELVDSFETAIDMQEMHTGQNVTDPDTQPERSMRPHSKCTLSRGEDSSAIFAALSQTSSTRWQQTI